MRKNTMNEQELTMLIRKTFEDAAFETHRLTRDEHGRYRERGMYEETWRQALRNAIQWTTRSGDL